MKQEKSFRQEDERVFDINYLLEKICFNLQGSHKLIQKLIDFNFLKSLKGFKENNKCRESWKLFIQKENIYTDLLIHTKLQLKFGKLNKAKM